jgi:hypothetical protein
MEQALAAIHQAQRHVETISLLYAAVGGQVGPFLQFADHLEEMIAGLIAANYPNCNLASIESVHAAPRGWKTWCAELELRSEIFPILRHSQFEDLLNGNFADPVSGILRAVKPGEGIRCSVVIRIVLAPHRRWRIASAALRHLDREFFRHRHRLAEFYADRCTRRGGRFASPICSIWNKFVRQPPDWHCKEGSCRNRAERTAALRPAMLAKQLLLV